MLTTKICGNTKLLKHGFKVESKNYKKEKMQKDEKPNYGYEHAKSKNFFVRLPQNFMQYILLYNEMHA